MRKKTEENINKIAKEIAEEIHNSWLEKKKNDGFKSPLEFNKEWKPIYDDHNKAMNMPEECKKEGILCHQDMIPFENLSQKIQDYDIETGKTALKSLIKKGYRIIKPKKK